MRLLCSLWQMGTWIHEIVCVAHYYKGEHVFIRLSALFIIKKGNENSSECLRCSLLQRGTWLQIALFIITNWNVNSSVCLRCLSLQKGTWIHQIIWVVNYSKGEIEFVRLSACFLLLKMGNWLHEIALFIITKWKVNSSNCPRCSFLQRRMWFHQIVCVFIITMGIVNSSDFLRCSLWKRGTWLHYTVGFVH